MQRMIVRLRFDSIPDFEAVCNLAQCWQRDCTETPIRCPHHIG